MSELAGLTDPEILNLCSGIHDHCLPVQVGGRMREAWGRQGTMHGAPAPIEDIPEPWPEANEK